MSSISRTSFGATLALLLLSAPVAAQSGAAPGTTTGLSLGLHASSASLSLVEDGSTTFGGGMSLSIGYGFTPRFSLHASTAAAVLRPSGEDRWLLGHADVEGRLNFSGGDRDWVPHIALGLGMRTANFEIGDSRDEIGEWHGNPGLILGGGLGYFLSPRVSIDASLRYGFGNLRQMSCPEKGEAPRTCATSTRLNVGASWYMR
jgi:opacity protein-like surface antigen